METASPPRTPDRPNWRARLAAFWHKPKPGLMGFLNGFVIGAAITAALMTAWSGLYRFTGLGWFVDFFGSGLVCLISIILCSVICLAIFSLLRQGLTWLADRLPRRIGWLLRLLAAPLCLPPIFLAGFFGIVLFTVIANGWSDLGRIIAPNAQMAPLIIGEAIFAATLGAAIARRAGKLGWVLTLLPIIAFHGFVVWLVITPGYDDYLARPVAVPRTAQLALPDPSQPGSYPVERFSYGSGRDRHRAEYGANADWITPSVSVDKDVWDLYGFAGAYNRWFWGFDLTAMPLNALVWAPEGDGPFPLVLIAHGNHAMGDFSEFGYKYLCEHLATHGYICTSLDQNFLNGSWAGEISSPEYPLRAFVMLSHVDQWVKWNADPKHPFYGKVDVDNIALAGHSRGGQTATLAAMINQTESLVLTGIEDPLNNNYGIRAVIAIAPNEGSTKINGKDAELHGINYLLLQGAHDADVATFQALRQYPRVYFEPGDDAFKAIVYSYRSNHGLFNSAWQFGDAGMQMDWALNLKPLLPEADQQRIARTAFTAFLNASLKGQAEYRRFFQAPWEGQDWLPAGNILLTRYQDDRFVALQSFKNVADKERVKVEGATLDVSGFSKWALENLTLRDGTTAQNMTVARLEWTANAAPEYTITLPAGSASSWQLSPASQLTFSLAHAQPGQDDLDVVIEMTDETGNTASFSLSSVAPIQPLLITRLAKTDWLGSLLLPNLQFATPWEKMLQTYCLPLAEFVKINPAFDPARLRAITLRFSAGQGGQVYLDAIGLLR